MVNDLAAAARHVRSDAEFNRLALATYAYQKDANPAYARYLQLSGQAGARPTTWQEIPCLPLDLFRTQDLRSGQWEAQTVFTSSGTTGSATSRHPVRDLDRYVGNAAEDFERLTGRHLGGFVLLALLPSYLERSGSGLIAMIDGFMPRARPGSDYYLHDHAALRGAIAAAHGQRRPVLLWGVSYALLDLAEEGEVLLPADSLVIETGGMKGRRRELTRDELHERLYAGLRTVDGATSFISSEYGMTELSSQAYLDPARAAFVAPPQLRVAARDPTDPFALRPFGKTGPLNLVDLGNYDTCSFLQSDDLGRVRPDGSFEVLGRQDGAAVRGCNLLLLDD